jgi:hypothetical protein
VEVQVFSWAPELYITNSNNMKDKIAIFGHVFVLAFLGILAGSVLGFVFGGFIGYVTEVLTAVGDGPNVAIGVFLGMGVGSVVGGIFGGVIGYKK